MKIPYVDRIGETMPYKMPRKVKKAWKKATVAQSIWTTIIGGEISTITPSVRWVPCQGWTVYTYTIRRQRVAK